MPSLEFLTNCGELHFNIDEVGADVFDGITGFRHDMIEYSRKHKTFDIVKYNDVEWINAKTLLKIVRYIQRIQPTDKITAFIKFLRSQGVRVKRKKFSPTVWKEVGFRQKWCCNVCNEMLKPTFELDHIISLEDNGPDDINNLQGLCVECHAIKTRDRRLRGTRYVLKTSPIKKVKTSKYFEEYKYKRRKID